MSNRTTHKPTWFVVQQRKLRAAITAGLPVAYVVTDAWGRPSNGGSGTVCVPGVVQEIEGPLKICTSGALHGTATPHRWRGVRVWVAIFHGKVQHDDDKIGALRREIVGELHPDDVIDASAAVRMGLTGANLTGANLTGADLTRANLTGANLTGADLTGAYLTGADLTGAYLTGAYLTGADLTGAYLTGAYLTGAYLTGAYLTGADLTRANLTGAYCPCPPPGWVADKGGYLSREAKRGN